jgi:small subunit ribosomal protein S10
MATAPKKKTAEKKTPAAPKKADKAAAPEAAASPKKGKDAGTIPGIRIRLSAFDYRVLDEAAQKIIEAAERSGAVIHGPLPLPTKIRKFTVNKSFFVHKNARDQYEMRTHRRLIDLTETTFKTVESLQGLSLPSGVDIEIQMK